MTRTSLLVLLLLCTSAGSLLGQQTANPNEKLPTPLQIVEALVEAYNQHDAEAMVEQVATTVKSKIEKSMTAGRFVTIHERVQWKVKDVTRTQSSLPVFEIKSGKIQKVWYYPAQN